ncbi:hypothetical protein BH11MYX3_BH11MYX3_29710 [soil metagenome]
MLGRYELLATIGVGGMASVVLARQRGPAGFEKAVVVKLIHPHMAQDSVAVNMLLDEAKVAAQLDHQNIVHTYELGEAQGTYYIVMEYLAGESLGQVLKQGQKQQRPMSPFAAAKIVADAAEGLHYAHELCDFNGHPIGIVHRDVSPGNIVVQYNGAVKVVDFGIAKAQGRVTSTQDGELKGKYGYMSPEQIKNEALDRRSDVFSLGVVLWESLARRRLFQADNVAATLMQILTGDRTPPSAYDAEIPHALDVVALRSLAPDPSDRFQTIAEMKQAIDDAIWRARIGSNEIANHMTMLFSDRIETRKTLLARATREMLSIGDLEVLSTAFRDPSSGVNRPELRSEQSGAPLGSNPYTPMPMSSTPVPPSVTPQPLSWGPPAAVGRALNLPHIAAPPNLPPPTIQRSSWGPQSESGLRPSSPGLARGHQPDGAKPVRTRKVAVILIAGAIVGIALGVFVGVGGGGGNKDDKPVATPQPTVTPIEDPPKQPGSVAEAMTGPAPRPLLPTVPTVAEVNPPPIEAPPAPPIETTAPIEPTPTEAPREIQTPTRRPRVTTTNPPAPTPTPVPRERIKPAGSEDELYKKGTAAYLAGQFSTAESAYKQALSINRGYAPAHRGLGFLYQRMGETAKALQSLRTYLKLTPNATDGAAIRKRIQQLGGE